MSMHRGRKTVKYRGTMSAWQLRHPTGKSRADCCLRGLGCVSIYFLKLSFRDTLRLNTGCSAVLSRLSRQK